jgi:predicted GNAT superfamily acetyltransferase
VDSIDFPAVARDAWALAHEAARNAGVELRPLPALEDADRILTVMGATWPGHEPFPREVLRALADSGNVPFGAFAGPVMLGYVLGWVGIDPEEDGPHVHSHMLAAVPDHRHRGIGYALKLAQRAQALDQGLGEVRWTFDPLVARNGYFNLHKLGAVADRFDRNHYGAMVDEVNAGERSDRFTVRWDLEREPGPHDVGAQALALADEDGWPSKVRAPSARSVLVAVPPDYLGAPADERERAAAWRDASASAIEACLTAGMIAAGFDRDASSYVFALAEDVPR